jgi:predicted O-methyltransferase YrrM
MNVEEIKSMVDDLPMMSMSQAKEITSFIQSKNLKNLLELGFYHGVSSCYFAGVLDEMKDGHLTTIDLRSAEEREPNIEELLEKLGLSSYVTVYYEPTSYNWRLMKMIEENLRPIFDFCYIDGGHDWYNTGYAFCLVDKLLKPGGWILFDDMNWTFDSSPSLKNSEMVKNMPVEERETPQVKKVFDLLVKTHPQYHNFIEEGSWAYAQKKKSFWDRF